MPRKGETGAEATDRSGFTLIEVLVVLALLAALVAIVAPQVFSQLDKGDATQVANDLNSVSTGIKSFRVDVSPKFPGDIEDLVFQISTTTEDGPLSGGTYNQGQVSRWNGSYLEVDMSSTATAAGDTAFTTGFSGNVINGLDTASTADGTGPWVTIDVNGLVTSDCEFIDQQIDDGDLTTGRFICSAGTLTHFAVQQ